MIGRASSSILNWKEKIQARYPFTEYDSQIHQKDKVVFFGLYTNKDYDLFLEHKGEKTIVWCGSDILSAGWEFREIQKHEARHIVENELQQAVLRLLLGGKEPEIKYIFYGNPENYPLTYKRAEIPNVFISSHMGFGAERQAGLHLIEEIAPKCDVVFHIYGLEGGSRYENVVYHGQVSGEQFDEEVKNYQAGLRLHQWDGMGEVLSKNVLAGGYPISAIRYPYIDTYRSKNDLIRLLNELKNRREPNYVAREFYLKEFNKPLLW